MRVSAATVQSVIRDAVRASATAIHFDPQNKHVRVAYRVDGRLLEGILLPTKLGLPLIDYIKKLAQLPTKSSVPEEGHFRLVIDDQAFALRVSSLPLTEHEKLVVHVITIDQPVLTLAQLGLWGQNMSVLQAALSQPYGLLLTSGPINSGATTTLYSLLIALRRSNVAITTIEDAVPRPLEGITQTYIRPNYGLTFTVGLQAALRQDANIIMLSNLLDRDTLDATLQAALGGRLVLSNIYAANAIAGLQRLLDFGIEPFMLSAALRAMASQRLVRTLCPACKESYKPEKHEILALLHACMRKNRSSLGHLHTLEQQAAHEGIGADIGKKYSVKNDTITTLWRANPHGCNACHHRGYKGQTGIFEVLPLTSALQTLLANRASLTALRTKAIDEGMVTLQTDGLVKALRGQTTVEELLRVLSSY